MRLLPTLRRHPLLTTFVVLAFWMIALRWQLRHEPLDRDISVYAVIGRELLTGRPLYSDLWDHKPPGVHLVFAAATAAVGPGVAAVLAVNVVGSLLVLGGLMVAGRRLGGRPGALGAGVLWALVGGDIGLQANQPNTELLINVCVAWALAASLGRGAATSKRVSWSIGILTGLAMLLKPVALVPMALLAAVRTVELGRSSGTKEAISETARWTAGAAIPVTAAIGWALARSGAGPVWDALVRYNLAYPSGNLGANILELAGVGRHLPVGSLLVLVVLLVGGAVGLPKLAGSQRLRLLAVLAGSAVAVAAPGRFYPHYYQLVLPPLVLAASTGMAAALRWRAPGRVLAAAGVLGIAAVELPAITADPGSVSRRKYGEVFVAEKRLAEHLTTVVEAEEPFWQLGPQPGLYLLTRTVPASGVVYDYPLLPGSPLRTELATRVVAALDHVRPRVIVVRTYGGDRGVLSWIRRHYRRAEVELPAPGYEIWTMKPPSPPAPIDAQDPIFVNGFEDGAISGWNSDSVPNRCQSVPIGATD